MYKKRNTDTRFVNELTAIMAATALVSHFASQGFCCSCYFNTRCKIIELDVHFGEGRYPNTPQGYLYSSFEISSSMNRKVDGSKVLVKEYTFKY